MSLFSRNNGYDVIKDAKTGTYIIRTPGPYGVKVGEAKDKAEVKRIIEGLK